MVYTSESLSLAALEVLVHVDRNTIPADLVQLEADVPDDLAILQIHSQSLPKDWRTYPGSSLLQRKGDEWLAARSTAVLQVPSSVIVEESNFLLNPEHAEAHRFAIVSVRNFVYDSRPTP